MAAVLCGFCTSNPRAFDRQKDHRATATQKSTCKYQEMQKNGMHSQGHRSRAGSAAKAAAPDPPPTPADIVLRRYDPDTDHADVVHICRNVYGGTDELPLTINAAASQPGTHILVACMGSKAAPLDALLCCQQRGDVLWLWGARTREERRGNGLAQALLDEAERLARQLAGVATLLSVTVPANTTMRRIFERRGLTEQGQVVSWPATPVSLAAHRQLLDAAKDVQQPSILSVLPDTAAVLSNPAAQRLMPRWRQCRSSDELLAALLSLRQQRTEQQLIRLADLAGQQQQQINVSGVAGGNGQAAGLAAQRTQLSQRSQAFTWLPAEYELLPHDSDTVQQLIEQGAVWLLEAAAEHGCCSSQQQPHQVQQDQATGSVDGSRQAGKQSAALLVLWGPGFKGVHHAGIVAGSKAALESALLCAAGADPRCCRFYVDCCGQFDHPRLWATTPGERDDMLPYFKVLQPQQL